MPSKTTNELSPAALSRKRLDEAQALYELRKSQLAEVSATARASLVSSDVDLAAVALARVQLPVCEEARDIAKHRVNSAENALVPETPDLADALVPYVTKALPRVNVSTGTAEIDPPESLPHLHLVQRKVSERRPNGTLAGDVEMFYFRDTMHREADFYSLGLNLDDDGVRINEPTGQLSETSGDQARDSITLTVRSVMPERAVIAAAVTARTVEGAASRIAARTAEKLGDVEHYSGVRIGNGNSASGTARQGRERIAEPGKCSGELVSDQERNGKRIVTVEATLKLRRTDAGETSGRWDISRASKALAAAVDAEPGHVHPGLGLCTEAKVIGSDPASVTARLSFESEAA